jgi:hypothetical protein
VGVAPARAADVVFGDPVSTPVYGESINFTIPMQHTGPLARLELRLRFPDSLGPFVEDVPFTDAASQSVTYTLDVTGGSHLVPNTTIEATWAAYPELGQEPVLSAVDVVRYEDTTHDWRSVKGDVLTVHWYAGDEAFARSALEIGEQAVKDTADLLGVTDVEPVDFFIYGDAESFREALGPGTRENVGGQAHIDIRTLFALIQPESIGDAWVGIVIPHELVHIVFDQAVNNPFSAPPRWVNEGLAVYLSEGYVQADRSIVENAVRTGELMPLTALTAQFPTDPGLTSLAYAESVAAIDYLVRTYGQPAMLALVDAYAEGVTDDEAFTTAVGKDVAAFQAGWLGELGATEPEERGPQPNPPGPVPPGWEGQAPGQPTAPPGTTDGAPTSAPTATPPAGSPDGGSSASTAGLVLVAVGLVVVLVVAGLVVARRRTDAAP